MWLAAGYVEEDFKYPPKVAAAQQDQLNQLTIKCNVAILFETYAIFLYLEKLFVVSDYQGK